MNSSNLPTMRKADERFGKDEPWHGHEEEDRVSGKVFLNLLQQQHRCHCHRRCCRAPILDLRSDEDFPSKTENRKCKSLGHDDSFSAFAFTRSEKQKGKKTKPKK